MNNNTKDSLLTADKLIKSRNFDEAKEILQEIIKIDNKSTQAFNLLGIVSVNLKEPEKANIYFKKGLESDPKNITLLKNLSLTLKMEKKYQEANKYLNTLYKLSNTSEAVIAELVNNLIIINKENEAHDLILRSLINNPESETLNLVMGNVLYELNKWKDSEKYFKKALLKNEFNFYALFRLSFYRIENKEYEKSISYLNKICNNIEKFKNHKNEFSLVYYNLGYAYDNLKKTKEAEKYYLQSYEINPNELNTLVNLSYLYFETRKLDKALEFINKAISLYPNNRILYNNLSKIYSRMGNHLKAVYYNRLGNGVVVFKTNNEYGLFEIA